MSRKECEDKWHNLKSQYSRELAKRKSSKGTGSATSNVYYSTWYAFESMQFIRDNYKPLSHRSTHEVVPMYTPDLWYFHRLEFLQEHYILAIAWQHHYRRHPHHQLKTVIVFRWMKAQSTIMLCELPHMK
ncbi:uncharacterized protein LOC124716966 isoform X1 [Schistocerca piceifrons]|uniref:uncharacterized protein LOC124716966 isoform X1 n=1 Tax=Schistocerca piceifrons TaxID=274613 RepID=UPI001F5ED38C|nr:uncharacterized protein LOC124716966 isoform X1 [Schistocerca piceifrons]